MKNLLIAVSLISTLLLSACGGTPSTPQSLQTDYFAALKAKDQAQVIALSSQAFKDKIAKQKEANPEGAAKNFEMMCKMFLANVEGATESPVVVSGDTASIVHTKDDTTFTVNMVKENETWLVNKCSISNIPAAAPTPEATAAPVDVTPEPAIVEEAVVEETEVEAGADVEE